MNMQGFGQPSQQQQAYKLKDTGTSDISPPVQLSFPNLDEKSKPFKPGDQGSYGATGLILKSDEATLGWFVNQLLLYTGCADISQIPVHPFVNGKSPWIYNDGDHPSKSDYQGYQGKYYFRATTQFESIKEHLLTMVEMDGSPVLGPDGQPASEPRSALPSEFYPGCWVCLVVACKEYDPGKIKFYLQGMLKVHAGEKWAVSNNSRELANKYTQMVRGVVPAQPQSGFATQPVQAPQTNQGFGAPAAQAPQGGFAQAPQFGAPAAQAPQGGFAQAPQFGAPAAQAPQGGFAQAPQGGFAQAPQFGAPAAQAPQGGFGAPAGFGAPQAAPTQAPGIERKGSTLSSVLHRS